MPSGSPFTRFPRASISRVIPVCLHCAKCWPMWPHFILTVTWQRRHCYPHFVFKMYHLNFREVQLLSKDTQLERGKVWVRTKTDSRACVVNHGTDFPQKISVEYRWAKLNQPLPQQPQGPAIKIWGRFVIPTWVSQVYYFWYSAVNMKTVPQKNFSPWLREWKSKVLEQSSRGQAQGFHEVGTMLGVIRTLGNTEVTARIWADQKRWVMYRNSHLDQWFLTSFNPCKTPVTVMTLPSSEKCAGSHTKNVLSGGFGVRKLQLKTSALGSRVDCLGALLWCQVGWIQILFFHLLAVQPWVELQLPQL